MTSGAFPPWKVSIVKKTPYIPGLRPEGPPPGKQFTVHLHCILDALSSPPPSTPRTSRSKSARSISVTSRLYTPKKQHLPPRPATAPSNRPKTTFSVRTPELGKKSLTPTRMKGDIKKALKSMSSGPKAGSEKPITIKPRPKPKAGSYTPVAIRRPPKIPQVLLDYDDDEDKRSVDSNENIEAKHGYYVYIDGMKVYTNQPPGDGKPTASVRPMLASDLIIDTDDTADDIKDCEKDLKPVQMSLESSGDSMEASQ